MKIFFLRHGKAEERLNGLEDAKRTLTKEGIELLQRDMPYLAYLLNNFEFVQVWTSPLLRAKQTTTILVEKLNNFKVDVDDFLATGDTQLLKQKLLYSNDECVVLVGHNPFFDDWVSELSSEDITIKKGETVMIELFDKDNFEGRIINRFKPQRYDSELNSIRLNDLFKEKYDVICAQKDLFLSEVDQPKRVHSFRISIRRYRSLLSLLKPLFIDDFLRDLDKLLNQLLRNLSYLRELDVLIARYESYLENNSSSVLLNTLKEMRKEEELRVEEVVRSHDFETILSVIFTNTKNAFSPKGLRGTFFDDFVELRIEVLYLKIKKMEKILNINKIEDLHRYRISWKRLRYALEIADLNDKKSVYSTAKMSQDLLGDICDIDVNIQLMKKIFSSNTNKEIEKEKYLFIEKEQERIKELRQKLLENYPKVSW